MNLAPSCSPGGRAVITGIGLATPMGISPNEVLEACLRGETAVRQVHGLEGLVGTPSLACGRVPAFDIAGRMRHPKTTKFMNRAVQCGLLSAYEAVADSGLDWTAIDGERIALLTASGQTGLEYHTFFPALAAAWEGDRPRDFRFLGRREAHLIDRYFSLRTLANGGLALLSMELGARGDGSNYVHSDAGFAMALGTACANLEERRCDIALVGAYDCLLTPSNYLAYDEAGLLSRDGGILRPFDRGASGIVLSEGAAFFVLERESDARQRGAEFVELTGVGLIQEYCASGMNRWSSDDLSELIADSGIADNACDCVVAHGVGIPEIDTCEVRAWSSILSQDIPVTAFKGLTGYVGAATAAVELALTILCLRGGWIPPVAGCSGHNGEIDIGIDIVTQAPRRICRTSASAMLVSRSWAGTMAAIGIGIRSETQEIPASGGI